MYQYSIAVQSNMQSHGAAKYKLLHSTLEVKNVSHLCLAGYPSAPSLASKHIK
jgi:hypothetical protein